ncbi:MAG: hypothetical protein ACI4ES_04520 [Roseburia sp.]
MSRATAGIAVSLNSTYYMRRYYKNCTDAMTSSKRSDFSESRLSQADANALRRAVRELRNFDYNSDANDNMFNSVTAFIETYNNTLDTAANSSNATFNRYAKQLKSAAKECASDLKELGITVNTDGSLDVNQNLLKKATSSEIGKLFSNDGKFGHKIQQISKRLEARSEEAYNSELLEAANLAATKRAAAQTTGLGLNVDITL